MARIRRSVEWGLIPASTLLPHQLEVTSDASGSSDCGAYDDASVSQASIGWWGFRGQDGAVWSSCRQMLHRAMALAQPVKA